MVQVIWAAILVLLAAGCSDNSTSISPANRAPAATPSPTPGTPAPAPTPSTGSATLRWQAPTETSDGQPLTDLAGYRVYYGLASFKLDRWLMISDPADTSAVITGLSTGTWYFAVTAFTRQGVESSMSSVVSKRL